jgi:hypothetical protein
MTQGAIFSWLDSPSGPRPPHCRDFVMTLRQIIRYDSSGRVIGPSKRPLRDNTQHTQENRHPCPGDIRTRNPSKRAAADPRLRPRGHWDRHSRRQPAQICICIYVKYLRLTTTRSVLSLRIDGMSSHSLTVDRKRSPAWGLIDSSSP